MHGIFISKAMVILVLPIKTERLIIREYKKTDVSDLCRVFSRPQIYATTCGIPKKCNKYWGEWWINAVHSNSKQRSAFEFGIFLKSSGRYIGNIGLINMDMPNRSGDITYIIDSDFWNCGFATEAALKMLDLGFVRLRLKRIGGSCMAINSASRRVMEKLGFKYEGTSRCRLLKDGYFYDLDYLSILDSDFFTMSNII